jgi:hypothetical protein
MLASCYLSCSLGLTTRRTFRLHGEDFTVVDWISLVITEQAFIFSIGFVQAFEY